MKQQKFKVKLLKILLISFSALPIFLFQISCSNKDNESEKLIHELNEKLRNLEAIKKDLDFKFEPFEKLMKKYNTNSFDGLMEKLTDLADPNLRKDALLLANCLLETQTITLAKLRENLNNKQWKNENKKNLNDLIDILHLNSLDELTSHFVIDSKIGILAEEISMINGSKFIKKIKNEILKVEKELKENKEKLISCYLAQLADEKYIDWENFVKQFNVQAWKNDKKNKPTIENLLPLLNCSIEDLDANKINDLDEQITNDAQKFIKKWKDIINEFNTKITELESELNGLKDKLEILKNDKDKDWNKLQDEKTKLVKELSEKNDELISYYIARLVDENYIDWENFIKQFDSKEWKENGKRQPTIKKLIEKLNCSIDDLNANKINGLGEKIVGEAKRLINEYLEPINKLKGQIDGLQDKNKKCKKQLISYYLFQLADKDHTNWDDFVKQFNDKTWKNVLGRSLFTEKLAEELDCSIDDLDTNKINNLDTDTIDETKRLINKYLEPINDFEKKINELQDKNKEYEKQLISCYFAQLTDENYTDWDNFVQKFNNPTWKNSEESKPTIENLIGLLNCTIEELNTNKINSLDGETIDSIKESIDIYQKPIKELKSQINEREGKLPTLNKGDKDYDKVKNELISCYIARLADKKYIDWENFIKQFNDQTWKNSDKRQLTIKKLAEHLNCSIEQLDANKINGLDEETKSYARSLIKEYTDSLKDSNNKTTNLENSNDQYKKDQEKLISFYLVQLADKDHTNWDNFVTQFDNPTWKNDTKNQPTIKKLVTLLKCSIEDLNANKINNLDTDTIDEAKRLIDKYLVPINDFEKKINELQDKNKEYEKQLISCYLAQLTLTDKDYTNWEDFVQKFNNPTWKNSEENKPTIENLIGLLNCTIDDLDANKINSLDGETITSIKGFIDIYQKPIKGLKDQMITLKNTNDQYKNELVSYCLVWLVDEKYTTWYGFLDQFNDQKWKEDKNNKPTIEILARLLNCTIEQLNSDKISNLSPEIKKKTLKLIEEKQGEISKLRAKITTEWSKKYDEIKNDFITYCLTQLTDENYTTWDDFVKQFDDNEWKEDKNNKPTIEILARLLNCTIEQLNSDKINGLNEETKTKTQNLINEKKTTLDESAKKQQYDQTSDKLLPFLLFDLWVENSSLYDWDSFVTQFDDNEWKEDKNNKPTIEILARLLNCTIEQLNSDKIGGLDDKIKNKTEDLFGYQQGLDRSKKNEKKLISYYLAQLVDEKYIDWDNFVKQFDNSTWKNKDKNKPTIENLIEILDCSIEDLNANKISNLGEEIIGEARRLIEDLENKNKQYEKDKNELISYYLVRLVDKSYTSWDDFVEQFDDLTWKNRVENQSTIEKIAKKLNCSIADLNANKINNLDKEIIDEANQLIEKIQKTFSRIMTSKEKIEKEQKKYDDIKEKLLPFYLSSLWDENYFDWDTFATKFDDEQWRIKHQQQIEDMANFLGYKSSEISKKLINTLMSNDIIKESVEKFIMVKDLVDLLNANGMKNLEELRQKIDEWTNISNRVRLIYGLCCYLQKIGPSLNDIGIRGKMTVIEIDKKTIDKKLSPMQKKALNLLSLLMSKLNIKNIDELIRKIDDWIEILRFIINGKNDDISLLKQKYDDFLNQENMTLKDEMVDSITKSRDPSKIVAESEN